MCAISLNEVPAIYHETGNGIRLVQQKSENSKKRSKGKKSGVCVDHQGMSEALGKNSVVPCLRLWKSWIWEFLDLTKARSPLSVRP